MVVNANFNKMRNIIDVDTPLKETKDRGTCKTRKIWILVIARHNRRVVHLELEIDITTKELVLAIKCFCNRCSNPKIIHSHNTGEFIQGKSIIRGVIEDLSTYKTHQTLQDGPSITWYHAPSKSPSHSGVIERIVHNITNPLIKTLRGAILTETEFFTTLTDIEACINSRPLAKLSENIDDTSITCIKTKSLDHRQTPKTNPSRNL